MTALPVELPHNFEAEQCVLGTILLNNAAWSRVEELVAPEHFADPLHGELFADIGKLLERGLQATAFSLKTYAETNERLKAVGGPKYLARLMAASAPVVDISTPATLVRDAYVRRRIIRAALAAIERANREDFEATAEQQIELLERELYAVAESDRHVAQEGFLSFSKLMATAVNTFEAAYRNVGQVVGVATGFHELDKLLGGLRKASLVVLAGRPAMGKTALATNIAFHAARNGTPVGLFSLEMSGLELTARIMGEQAGVPANLLERGAIQSWQFDRVIGVATELEKMPLFVDDRSQPMMAQIRNRARRLKRQHGLGLVVIDYLQLIQPVQRRDGRVNEISEISRGLKALAKELDIPVLALSQLSREVEKRDDKRPMLSDLRESGSIEQDADAVLFVYRDEYYAERSEPHQNANETEVHFAQRVTAWETRKAKAAGRAELLLSKHRHGPIGTVPLTFEGQYTRFGNIAGDEEA